MSMKQKVKFTLIALFFLESVYGWGVQPLSYYQRLNDGSYNYGYDAGDGFTARQSANAANEVEGQYSQLLPNGKVVNVRYKAGVRGFQPLPSAGSQNAFNTVVGSPSTTNSIRSLSTTRSPLQSQWQGAPANIQTSGPQPDGTYSFSYANDDSSRREIADSNGNVRGSYSFLNNAGKHDLSYVAGSETGFQPTGGSLATANGPGVGTAFASTIPTSPRLADSSFRQAGPQDDGSYSFAYQTPDSTRQEVGDSKGNVQGSYSIHNDGSSQNFSFVARPENNIQSPSRSLSLPNNHERRGPTTSSSTGSSPYQSRSRPPDVPNSDGSYQFSYDAGDSARQESADNGGNVRGSYSYQNEAGQHDLSYIAGSNFGFNPTGGSLLRHNGHRQPSTTPTRHRSLEPSNIRSTGPNADGSYNFSYQNKDSARQESADDNGTVRGSYSFKNDAGKNDLHYIAGPEIGFRPTGGNLANSVGRTLPSPTVVPLSGYDSNVGGSIGQDGRKPTGFNKAARELIGTGLIDEPNHSQHSVPNDARHETVNGNGNLAPGHLHNGQTNLHKQPFKTVREPGHQSQQNTESELGYKSGNASYNFGYANENATRSENSDVAGNVVGKYSYRNDAGNHDLSYEAGPSKGFVVTGGSLAAPNGLPRGTPAYLSQLQNTRRGGIGSSSSQLQNSGHKNDGAYEFSYDTGKQAHQESRDENGRVQGKYSYISDGEQRDLSYRATPDTGFEVVGGSLTTKGISS